jgi:hypothetical protein
MGGFVARDRLDACVCLVVVARRREVCKGEVG